ATERPHQPFPEPLAHKPANLTPAITIATEPSQQPFPESLTHEPANLMPAITIATEPSQQLSPEALSLVQSYQKYKQKLQKLHKNRLSVLFAFCCTITIIVVVFMSQGNGIAGAWMADTLRAAVGPTITAQVESWYL